ncbi:MAG: SLC5/6 family protein, partial [Algiphilus sp.]
MFTSWQLLTVAALYVGGLFIIAWVADRRERHRSPRPRPWVYGLALAVYCTAWTFYGAVGRASADGLSYLPIYLGPALVFLFCTPLLRRLIQVCKSAQLTSVADFVGARYGNDPMLAAGVTVIALLAGLPYLALQLRAISLGFDVLTPDGGAMAEGLHSVTIITVLLAGFTMLFGTRHVASTESHHGLVTAVATESLLKLVAFIAVGLFALWALGGIESGFQAVAAMPALELGAMGTTAFWLQTALAGAAVIVLPRQFHLMVVEHNGGNELGRARWLFPLYLLIFAAFVLPLAAAGEHFVGAAHADQYVLALPQALGSPAITLLAFLGGFSAATGMVIVSCVALSTMLSNEIILPGLLRGKGYQRAEQDLGALLLRVRRLAIVGLLLVAWLIDRLMLTHLPLAMIGLLSFSAIAHLAPPVIAGILWSRSNRRGAIAGLV